MIFHSREKQRTKEIHIACEETRGTFSGKTLEVPGWGEETRELTLTFVVSKRRSEAWEEGISAFPLTLLSFLLFCFQTRSHYSPGWPRTHSADMAGLWLLADLPASDCSVPPHISNHSTENIYIILNVMHARQYLRVRILKINFEKGSCYIVQVLQIVGLQWSSCINLRGSRDYWCRPP